jgi:hypothetical protein
MAAMIDDRGETKTMLTLQDLPLAHGDQSLVKNWRVVNAMLDEDSVDAAIEAAQSTDLSC